MCRRRHTVRLSTKLVILWLSERLQAPALLCFRRFVSLLISSGIRQQCLGHYGRRKSEEAASTSKGTDRDKFDVVKCDMIREFGSALKYRLPQGPKEKRLLPHSGNRNAPGRAPGMCTRYECWPVREILLLRLIGGLSLLKRPPLNCLCSVTRCASHKAREFD